MPSFHTSPSVVCTVLEQGGVLLHLETKYYYSLNRTGLGIWTALEDGDPDPFKTLESRFPGVPDRDEALSAFLADLEAEKLVTRSDAPAGAPRNPSPDGLSAWERPALTRHAVPLSQILSNPFDPCVPLAE